MDDNPVRIDLLSLSSSSWRERRRALENLAHSDDETLAQALLEIIQKHHADLGLLNGALQLLKMQKAPVLDRLGSLLRDEDPEVRIYAALAIGEMGDPEGGARLLETLADPEESNPNVLFNVIEALGKLEVQEAVDPLIEVLEQGDFYLAYPAIQSLAAIGEVRAAEALTRRLSNPLLGPASAMALAVIAGEDAIDDLTGWLESKTAEVGAGARALAEIGRRADTSEHEHQIGQKIAARLSQAAKQRLLEAAARVPADQNLTPEQAAEWRSLAVVTGWLLAASPEGSPERAMMIDSLDRMIRYPASRAAAAEALLRSGYGAAKVLIRSLGDPDPEVRQMVTRILAAGKDPASVLPLEEALSVALEAGEEDLAVQTVEALGKIRSPAAFEPLLSHLANPSQRLRMAVAPALAALKHPDLGPRLMEKAVDMNPLVRETALNALALAHYPDAAGTILSATQDPNPRVRRMAVSAAAEMHKQIETGRLVEAVTRTLADPDQRVRAATARALGVLPPEIALPLLYKALEDPDPWTRIQACHSLGRHARTESIPHLEALSGDPLPPVRISVAEALSRIGGPEAQTILKKLLADPEIDVHTAVEVALTFFGQVGP